LKKKSIANRSWILTSLYYDHHILAKSCLNRPVICFSLQCFTNSESQNFMIFYIYFSILWPIRMGIQTKLVKWQAHFLQFMICSKLTLSCLISSYFFTVSNQKTFSNSYYHLLLEIWLSCMYFAQCTEFDYFFSYFWTTKISQFLLNDSSVCKWAKKYWIILHCATFLWTLQAVIMSRVFIMSYQLAE